MLPRSMRVGICADCGREMPLVNSARFSGLCRGCYNSAMVKASNAGPQGRRIAWTPAEETRLRDMYADASKAALLAAFPHRSWFSIYHRASALGLHGGCINQWCHANATNLDHEPIRSLAQLSAEAAALDDGTIDPLVADLIAAERKILRQLEKEHYAQLQTQVNDNFRRGNPSDPRARRERVRYSGRA